MVEDTRARGSRVRGYSSRGRFGGMRGRGNGDRGKRIVVIDGSKSRRAKKS